MDTGSEHFSKINKWPISTQEDIQHHQQSEKYKSKPQWHYQ